MRDIAGVLGADLRDLTDGGRLSVLPSRRPREWDLSEEDIGALWTHGLPPARDDEVMTLAGDFQSGQDPELEEDGVRLYRLGVFGVASIAALPGTGTVLALPRFREVHPALRHLHPDGVRPGVVNSTVAGTVDCAWRWYWLAPLLADLESRAGAAEVAAWREGRAHEDFYAACKAACRDVAAAFRDRDPAATDFWEEVITPP